MPSFLRLRAGRYPLDLPAKLLSAISPWEVSFREIHTFPHTSIAYLAPADRQPFDRVHELLRGSALPTSPSQFPYNPHCTLRSGNATPEELSRVIDHQFPTAPFTIDTISIYDFDSDAIRCDLNLRLWNTAASG
jgi:2'-5' RNA ligase